MTLGQIAERLKAIYEELRALKAEEKALLQEQDLLLYDGWSRSHQSPDWVCLESPTKEWALNVSRYSLKATLWHRGPTGYPISDRDTILPKAESDEELGKAAVEWAKGLIASERDEAP